VPHFRTTLGTDFARILSADGWEPEAVRLPSYVVLWKGNLKPVSITLYQSISKKRVESICKTARITAARFEELMGSAPVPSWMKPVVH
jgi:hypothetical protein